MATPCQQIQYSPQVRNLNILTALACAKDMQCESSSTLPTVGVDTLRLGNLISSKKIKIKIRKQSPKYKYISKLKSNGRADLTRRTAAEG